MTTSEMEPDFTVRVVAVELALAYAYNAAESLPYRPQPPIESILEVAGGIYEFLSPQLVATSSHPEPELSDPGPDRERTLTLTVRQIDIITDALFGQPPSRAVAHSVQSVLWDARWGDSE